jgi:hypothetical protein
MFVKQGDSIKIEELPSNLKIGSHNYKVICPYQFKERGDLTGQHDASLLKIIHAIDSASGLRENCECAF